MLGLLRMLHATHSAPYRREGKTDKTTAKVTVRGRADFEPKESVQLPAHHVCQLATKPPKLF